MQNEKKEFGKRLAEIRKSKKIKQDELREMIGAPTVQMISGWENGHSFPSSNYLIILAKKLDTSLDYLLLGKNETKNEIKINSYKDAASYVLALHLSKLFKLSSRNMSSDGQMLLSLESTNDEMVKFKLELDNLLIASQTLKPELFRLAIIDLLEKYDFPISISTDSSK